MQHSVLYPVPCATFNRNIDCQLHANSIRFWDDYFTSRISRMGIQPIFVEMVSNRTISIPNSIYTMRNSDCELFDVSAIKMIVWSNSLTQFVHCRPFHRVVTVRMATRDSIVINPLIIHKVWIFFKNLEHSFTNIIVELLFWAAR